MRKEMTAPERKLWYEYLARCPVRFLRQKPLGDYIVDFYCARKQLVIEIDGDSHYSRSGVDRDVSRSAWLKSQGITVMRFSNEEVMRNFEGVCSAIEKAVGG